MISRLQLCGPDFYTSQSWCDGQAVTHQVHLRQMQHVQFNVVNNSLLV